MPRSRLLDLPPELRDAIYEFALTAEKTVVTYRLDAYERDTYDHAVQPALTRVNRQVRDETLPIYYGCNDFILHTESGRYSHVHRWLLCNEPHLLKLKRVSLWVRFFRLGDGRGRAASQGAVSVSMQRDIATGCWKVDENWRWITVVRKPEGLETHGDFLVRKLRQLLVNESTSHLNGEAFAALLVALRSYYLVENES